MKKTASILLPLAFSLLPFIALAQQGSPSSGSQGSPSPAPVQYNIKIDNPLANGIDNLPDLLNFIIKKIINPIGAVLAVLMIMYAGFLYVTAQGNTTKIAAAHQALLYAAIGAAILLGANLIATAIQTTVTQLN